MYLSGEMGCGGGCLGDDGLGQYLGSYLGEDTTPWWASLITAGENIAASVLRPTTPGYTAPYNPAYPPAYPPNYGTPGIFPSGAYQAPAGPPIVPQQTNWLPYILGGGLLLYVLTR